MNVCDQSLNLDSEDEKKALEEQNKQYEELFKYMKEVLGDKVNAVRFTNKLSNHPVCLTSEGGISLEMEKTLNAMPGAEQKVKAQIVLEINSAHTVADKLIALFENDKDTLSKYAKLLYNSACLICGKAVDDPLEHSNLLCELMTK